jgi:hypothetical protein
MIPTVSTVIRVRTGRYVVDYMVLLVELILGIQANVLTCGREGEPPLRVVGHHPYHLPNVRVHQTNSEVVSVFLDFLMIYT